MSSIDKRLCFGLIFCAVLQSTLAIAQTDRVTLGDYIATQRAVLEAEVLKVQQTANQSRNATGSVSPVDAKAANVPDDNWRPTCCRIGLSRACQHSQIRSAIAWNRMACGRPHGEFSNTSASQRSISLQRSGS
jgi:hypothetical protein